MQTGASVGTEQGGPAPVVAYLLLTHKDPHQVESLARRILELSGEGGRVVVHHDLKAGPMPWNGSPPPGVHLVDRVQVEWGDWSIVEATLRMVRYAHDELHASWFVVVSGEHWPVADLEAWERALERRQVDAYLPADLLPRRLHFGRRDRDGNRFLARCVHRWFRFHRPRSDVLHRVLAGLAKISLRLHPLCKLEYSLRGEYWFVGVPRSRGPVKGWNLYKGSEWIAFNARAVQALLDVAPDVLGWFKRSHIPDESYVQTVIRRSPDIVVESTDVTWVPPEPGRPTARWMLLKEPDLDVILASGVAFARKVDPARNPEVISAINVRVDSQRHGVGPAAMPLVDVARDQTASER